MDGNQLLLHCRFFEFSDERKSMIADALQTAVDDMSTKHQPTPTVLPLASDLNDAAKSLEVLQTLLNAAVPITVVKNEFTDVTQFPTIGHLLDDIRATGSFVTLTDMTQDALQVQEINLDAIISVEAAKELPTKVPESEIVDVKVESEIDFEEELETVLMNNVEISTKYNSYLNEEYKTKCEPDMVAENSHIGTKQKDIDEAQNINKSSLRHSEMLQNLTNAEEIELEVNVEDQVDFEAELAKLSKPCLLRVKEKSIETIKVKNTIFNKSEYRPLPNTAHKLKSFMASEPSIKNESLLLFKCPECNYDAKSYDDWKQHTNGLHNFNTIEKINMQSVKNTLNNQLGLKCRKCSATYTSASDVREEVITHHINHLPFKYCIKCRLCEQKFNILGNAKRHLRLNHPEHYCVESVNPLDYISIHCPTCNMQQRNHKSWTEHLALRHNFFMKCTQQFKHIVDDYYSCNRCLKSYKKTAIPGHSLTHEPYTPFQCTICSIQCKFKTFTQRAVIDHVRREHLMNTNNVKCKLCGATFLSAQALQCHTTMYHKQIFGSCQTCNIEFFSISELVNHIHSHRHNQNK